VAAAPSKSDPRPPGPEPVVRRFLAGYLAYSYGRASVLPESTAALRARLLADPPRVPVVVRRRRPRVIAVTVAAAGEANDRVLALIADGVARYPIELDLAYAAGRWRVDEIDPQAF
jgi:hypothetical protein